MLRLIKHFIFSLVIAALVGCAAQVTQKTAVSPPQAIATRAGASVGILVAVVTGSPAVQGSGDWPDFLEEWQSSLQSTATTAKIPIVFAKSEASMPANAAVLVRLTVNDFKYVSNTRRFMLGILSGDAYMDIDAQYIKLPDMNIFGAKKFNTKSNDWEGIFTAVTPGQVQAVSEVILKDVSSIALATK